jgi:hypothetical protein
MTKQQALKHVEEMLAAAQKEEHFWMVRVMTLEYVLWGLIHPDSWEAVENKEYIKQLAETEWENENE